jgi:hypothetical protein
MDQDRPAHRARSSKRGNRITAESGLIRAGGVVVLSGPALRAALECALIAIKHRKWAGVPYLTFEALACEFGEAMAAAGHSDVRSPAIRKSVAVEQPIVPIAEAAARLGISCRQGRRLVPKLGGQIIAGRWFVDETALNEHIEGRQWTNKKSPDWSPA